MTAVPSQCGAGFEMSAFVHCRLCPDALVSVCTAPPEEQSGVAVRYVDVGIEVAQKRSVNRAHSGSVIL